MIMLALMTVVLAPGILDVEQALAERAEQAGYWSALEERAIRTALVLAPSVKVPARWENDRNSLPVLLPGEPTDVYLSCRQDYVITTGPLETVSGEDFGYFTTVWDRQRTGEWEWTIHHIGPASVRLAADEEPRTHVGECGAPPEPVFLPRTPGKISDTSTSGDRSLKWTWTIDDDGSRTFNVLIWTGGQYKTVIDDRFPRSD